MGKKNQKQMKEIKQILNLNEDMKKKQHRLQNHFKDIK